MSIGSGVFEGVKIRVFHWQGKSPLQQFCTTVQTVRINQQDFTTTNDFFSELYMELYVWRRSSGTLHGYDGTEQLPYMCVCVCVCVYVCLRVFHSFCSSSYLSLSDRLVSCFTFPFFFILSRASFADDANSMPPTTPGWPPTLRDGPATSATLDVDWVAAGWVAAGTTGSAGGDGAATGTFNWIQQHITLLYYLFCNVVNNSNVCARISSLERIVIEPKLLTQ